MADDIELYVAGGPKELAPQALHDGVIVDFINLGEFEETWPDAKTGIPTVKTKVKCKYVIELATKRTDGKQFNIGTQRFNATMGPRSSLEAFVNDVRGKRLTDTERKEFKAKALVGVPVKVLVKHVESGGKNYANINAIMPGGEYKASGKYVRWVPSDTKAPIAPAPSVAEDDVPF